MSDPTMKILEVDNLDGPKGLPIIGVLLRIDPPRFHQQLEKWSDQFGSIYRLKMFKRDAVINSDPQITSLMLRQRPDSFSRTRLLKIISEEMGLNPGLFGSEGDSWRSQRKMVMSAFDPAHVKNYFTSLSQVSGNLSNRWHRAAIQKKEIDLQADLMRYTVDTIAGLAFGVEVNTLLSDGDEIQQHLDKIFPQLFKRILSPFPYWRYIKFKYDRELEKSIMAVNVAIKNYIEQARESLKNRSQDPVQPNNLLEAMLLAADEPNSGIDDQIVSGNVMTMLLAGEDTTANTIAWMVYLLWSNPLELEKVNQEILRKVKNPYQPQFDEVNHLDYLDAVIQETMRLKPVAPQLPLQAIHDVQLAHLKIKAGTVVINLLRKESVSEKNVLHADQFIPQRWIAQELGNTDVNAPIYQDQLPKLRKISVPFGAGPRMCPGRYLAILEMKMVMVTLLGQFKILSVFTDDGKAPREELSFTMTPVGLKMILELRNP
jgi:cytochrome P450